MITVYRLVHWAALSECPDPFHPLPHPGRWHSGHLVVAAAADSVALVALQVRSLWGTHGTLNGYHLYSLEFDETDVEDVTVHAPLLDRTDLASTRAYGDDWRRSARSLALCLPSGTVPFGHDYLINPDHPRFRVATQQAHGELVDENGVLTLHQPASDTSSANAMRQPLPGAAGPSEARRRPR